MKEAPPHQNNHSVAIREGVEKFKQRLEEADCKIQVPEERLQAAPGKADFWVDSDMFQS